MKIDEIVTFWSGQQSPDQNNRWAHNLDRDTLDKYPHTFNLDHPVSPYVGDVLNAPVVVLGSNGGYDPIITPGEFSGARDLQDHINRIDRPDRGDWVSASPYYEELNYSKLLSDGNAVLVNACAYRSKKLSDEPENQRLLEKLPSVLFARNWLIEAVLPLAIAGQRLVIAKRHRRWNLPPSFKEAKGVIVDPAPISPHISSRPYSQIMTFLEQNSKAS